MWELGCEEEVRGVPFQVTDWKFTEQEGYAVTEVCQSNEGTDVVEDTLESKVIEGARQMLAAALEEEVDAFLGRDRYERSREFRGYRNGYHRSREVTVGVSAVEVKVPRVSDVPSEVSEDGYSSQIVRRYERSSRQTQELFRKLYMEGLSTGDFEPVFRELVGEKTALSANAIVRLKSRWESEYRSWRSGRLDSCSYAYIWADGVYLGAGGDREKTALLCVVGVREDGDKELVGMELGYRESTESWAGVMRGLRERGMSAPLLAVGDGALGLWSALDRVYPTTAHQRCWNHRSMNVAARLPKSMQSSSRRRLRKISHAPSRSDCERLRDEYVSELRAEGRGDAAEAVLRDWEDFVSFYDFPMEHWVHLRTTNPLESVFSAVRLRTNATRRMKRRDSALYLVYKVVRRLGERWKPLYGGRNLMSLLVDGARFKDGVLVELPPAEETAKAA